MNKAFKIVYSAIFFAVCAAPLAMLPFVKSNAEIEKKELAEMPSYIKDGSLNTDFSVQFEEWFNDRIPLRSEILSAANFVKGQILGTSSSNVISGRDGWLFYDNEKLDYMDTNAMSDARIRQAAITLSLIEEQVKAKGGRFTFVPMPNKASVYGEYMPFCYRQADENNLSRLCKELDRLGVNYTNMKKVMTDNKKLGVYHKRDSHWNYLGALIGYNAIMESLGAPHKSYSNCEYTVTKTWRGDLDKLLYPAGGFLDNQYYLDIEYDPFTFVTPAGVKDPPAQLELIMSDKEEGDDRFTIRSKGGPKDSKLYMARDSFGRALLPLMMDNYAQSTFERTDCPEISTLADGTDVVYEIVERNLKNLVSTAPYMYAPKRTDITSQFVAEDGSMSVSFSNEGYGCRIFGVFSDNADLGDGRVYVTLTGQNGSFTYEAFPIYDTKLLEGEDHNGFSMLIDPSEGLSGEYKLTVTCNNIDYNGDTVNIVKK